MKKASEFMHWMTRCLPNIELVFFGRRFHIEIVDLVARLAHRAIEKSSVLFKSQTVALKNQKILVEST